MVVGATRATYAASWPAPEMMSRDGKPAFSAPTRTHSISSGANLTAGESQMRSSL